MFIYYHPRSDETAHILASVALLNGGMDLPENPDTPILNWGKSTDLSKYTNVFNRTLIKDKLKSLQIMQDSGVSVPKFWDNRHIIPLHEYPILSRQYYHSCGTDIFMLKLPKNRGDYYVQYIPKVAEFRVHVIGTTSFISQKTSRCSENTICWNYHNGFIFRDINIYKSARATHSMRDLAYKAIKALGYDFGAVDIIVDEWDMPYCLEVNSAPALSDKRIKKYIELIKFNWG